ncbi:hypothetical protein HDV00_004694 [Rhizophlyctis rosea]|nr:hypothetical protein HDV00_004694 [Rhizophlyctis rosea]
MRKRLGVNAGVRLCGKGPKDMKEASPVAGLFHERYTFAGKYMRAPLTERDVEVLLGQMAKEGSGSTAPKLTSSPKSANALHKQWLRTHQLTPIEVLTTLHTALQLEMETICFDYISMHARCWDLLCNIRCVVQDALNEETGEDFGKWDDEHTMDWLVAEVLLCNFEEWQMEQILRTVEIGGRMKSVVMTLSNDVIRELVKREGEWEWSKLQFYQPTCM